MTQKIVVSAILRDKENRIFLAKRPLTKKIAPGKYHLPGGHVEFGESLEEALVREMAEEFDLTVKVGKIVGTFTYVNGENHTIGATFLLEDIEVPGVINFNKEDTEEIVFAREDEIENFLDKNDHDYLTIRTFFSM
jgi:mutator protein MutT